MKNFVWVAVAVSWLGCATTESEGRARQMAAGERLLRNLGDEHAESPEMRFQLGSLQLEEADALDRVKGSEGKASDVRLKALGQFNLVIDRHPLYERRGEVLFWRADALSGLSRWSDAVAAWRLVPVPKDEKNRLYARWRLAQALRHTHQCEDALALLEGSSEPVIVDERCRCLKALERACADTPQSP